MKYCSRITVVLLLILWGAACKPTVWGLVEENRAEITAHVAKLKEVGGKLDQAPAKAGGFDVPAGTVTAANTVVIIEADFDRMRTDPNPNKFTHDDWKSPPNTVRASTTEDLGYLIDRAREPKKNPPEQHVEVIQRALERMRATRFVAVPKAFDVESGHASGNRFTGSQWRGLVRVYDLEKQRWVGAVMVTVEDNRSTTTHSNITGPVSRKVDETIRKALDRGADTEGVQT